MPTAILVGGGLVAGTTPLVLDATLDVTPRFSNTVTRHPIETGSTITDHVFKNNTIIDVSGIISNSSIGNLFEDDFRFNRVQTVHDFLVNLSDTRQTISISSQFQTYSNCIITGLTLPRTPQTGDVIPVTITLEQIQVVSSQFIQVSQALVDAAARNQNKGQKTGIDSNNPNNSESDRQTLSRGNREVERTIQALTQ